MDKKIVSFSLWFVLCMFMEFLLSNAEINDVIMAVILFCEFKIKF